MKSELSGQIDSFKYSNANLHFCLDSLNEFSVSQSEIIYKVWPVNSEILKIVEFYVAL